MAHFAEIDSNNVVLRVIVVDNVDTAMADGTETESIGIAHCQKLFGGSDSLIGSPVSKTQEL